MVCGGSFGKLRWFMGFVVVNSGDRRLLLVNGGCIFSIWIAIPLQTGVVANVW